MANQPNYAPRELQGPFAKQLSAGANVSRAPYEAQHGFTGWEGGVGAGLGVFSKFLEGVGQGRMLRALSEERNKMELLQRYNTQFNAVMQNPEILPEDKARFSQKFTAAMIPTTKAAMEAGATPEQKKKGGFLHTMGQVLNSLAGGEINSPKYDLNAINSVMAEFSNLGTDPSTTVSGRVGQAKQGINAFITDFTAQNEGRMPTPQQLGANPVVREYLGILHRYDPHATQYVNDLQQSLSKSSEEQTGLQSARNRLLQSRGTYNLQQAPPGAVGVPTALQAKLTGNAPPPTSFQADVDQLGNTPPPAVSTAPPPAQPMPQTDTIVAGKDGFAVFNADAKDSSVYVGGKKLATREFPGNEFFQPGQYVAVGNTLHKLPENSYSLDAPPATIHTEVDENGNLMQIVKDGEKSKAIPVLKYKPDGELELDAKGNPQVMKGLNKVTKSLYTDNDLNVWQIGQDGSVKQMMNPGDPTGKTPLKGRNPSRSIKDNTEAFANQYRLVKNHEATTVRVMMRNIDNIKNQIQDPMKSLSPKDIADRQKDIKNYEDQIALAHQTASDTIDFLKKSFKMDADDAANTIPGGDDFGGFHPEK